LHLVLDLRLLPATIAIWINLYLILYFNNLRLSVALFILSFLPILKLQKNKKIIYFTSFMILLSTFIGFLRLDAVSNGEIDDMTNNKTQVKIVGVAKSDLKYRPNSNPFNTQGKWELIINSQEIHTEDASWRAEIAVLAIFNFEDSNVEYGSMLEIYGNAESSYRKDIALIVNATDHTLLNRPGPFHNSINEFRENFHKIVSQVNFSAAGLIPGLVSGDTRLQSVEFNEAMKRTGLTHLTAVSGGNIAILLAVFISFFKSLNLKRITVFILSVALLFCFLILVRFEPSALRATIMGLIGIWTLTFGGPRTGLGALVFSTFFLLLVDPWLAINWGFTLSVFATLGLILLAPEIQKLWIKQAPRTPRFIVLLFSLTLSAQIITYPLLSLMVNEISLVSLIANVLAMPTVAWVSVFGFLALIAASLIPPMAPLFVYLALPAAIWIELIAVNLSKLPFAQVSVSGQFFLVFIVLIPVVIGFRSHYRNRIKKALES
jgi:ComEC/Rec2-related protein